MPQLSNDASETLDFPVQFLVTNDEADAAPLQSWSVLQREYGASAWATGATGNGTGELTAQVSGGEGEVLELMVQVVDEQGSTGTSDAQTVSIPYDNTNALVTYPGDGEADWAQASGKAGYFLGTFQSSSKTGARIRIRLPAMSLLWIFGGPTTGGTASVTVDGTPFGSFSEVGTTTPGAAVYSSSVDNSSSRTVVIEVTSGKIKIDAIAWVP